MRAKEERSRDTPDRRRLQGAAWVVAASRECGAHPLHLVDDDEQVAVDETGDQHEQPGDTQQFERAQCGGERRGCPEQDGAERAEDGLDRDGCERGQPGLRDREWPELDLAAATDEWEKDCDEEHERDQEPDPVPERTRPDASDGCYDGENG